MGWGPKQRLDSCKRQKEATRLFEELHKPVVSVEPSGQLIFCIKRKDGEVANTCDYLNKCG